MKLFQLGTVVTDAHTKTNHAKGGVVRSPQKRGDREACERQRLANLAKYTEFYTANNNANILAELSPFDE